MRKARRSPFLFAVLMLLEPAADGLSLENRISPLNGDRPLRQSTRFIVLHTTEGAAKGATQKLRNNGEAHYLVLRSGRVLRLVDKDRVAYHAGKSMWAGYEDLDQMSIGIEVVGYHNRAIPEVQVKALAELIRQLRDIYHIPSHRVLTHAQVAYGSPNRYHRHKHRGRKRCAMNLATASMRKRLGLGPGAHRDPDVVAGRLRNADKTLADRLYPKQKRVKSPIASAKSRQSAASKTNTARKANTGATLAQSAGDPARTVLRPSSAAQLLGDRATASHTIYLFPDGMVRTGADLQKTAGGRRQLARLPAKTRILTGLRYGGYIKPGRPPSVACGGSWRSAKAVYRYPNGKLIRGDAIQPERLPKATMAFCSL